MACNRFRDGGCGLSTEGSGKKFETFQKATGAGDVAFSVLVPGNSSTEVELEVEVALSVASVADEPQSHKTLVKECRECANCDWWK